MKKILLVAFYELLRNIRDYKMILIIIICPILLIFILGSSLDSFLTMEFKPKPIIGYVNYDEGNSSESFDEFLLSDDIQKIMQVIEFNSKEDAEDLMKSGKINCIIFIGNKFSETLDDGMVGKIEIYGKESSTYAKAVVNSYINNYNTSVALIENNITASYNTQAVSIERGQLNSISLFPSSMDYYAVQTLLQLLLLCAVFGISIVLRDTDSGLVIRMKSLPIKKSQLLIGRLMGSIFYSFIAAIVTILFSKYVYGANWNGNIIIIGLAIFLFIVIAVGIGVLIANLTKNYTTAFGILALVSFVFPSSVGAFSPKSTIKAIGMFSPNLYAKNIIFGTIFKFPSKIIIDGFLYLFIMIFIVYGLIIFVEGRKKHENI